MNRNHVSRKKLGGLLTSTDPNILITSSAEPRASQEYFPQRLDFPNILEETSSPPSSLSKQSIVELEYSFRQDVFVGSISRSGRVIAICKF